MRVVISESQFKKDVKLAGKQNKNLNELVHRILGMPCGTRLVIGIQVSTRKIDPLKNRISF